MDVTLSFEQAKRWGMKSGIAIFDQSVFSSANFVSSLLLARWLDAKQFGEFAIGFTILILFMQIYTSFILEPIGILGPSNYSDRLVPYLRRHVNLLFALTVPVAILLAIIVVIISRLYESPSMLQTLFYSLLGLPLILFPLLMRRIFYVLQKPGFASLGSVVYFLGLMGSLFVIKGVGKLTGTTGVLLVLCASLGSGLVMLFFLKNQQEDSRNIDIKSIFVEAWLFGRWLIASGVLIGLATQSQVYLSGMLSRLEDAGVIRILQTYIQPMMLVSTALSALVTPLIASDFAAGAYASMRKKMLLFMLVFGGLAGIYEICLIIWGESISAVLFANKYLMPKSQIATWGILPIILSLFWGGAMALQASKRPQAMFVISVFWSSFSIVPAFILIPLWGVWGATISMLMGFVAALAITWFLYWLWVGRTITKKQGMVK